MPTFGAALLVLTLSTLFVRERCVFALAATLLVNWCACTAFVRVSGNPHAWEAFTAIDYVSGFFSVVGIRMILECWSRPAALIAISYGVLCLVHVSFGLSDQGLWAQYHYWYSTYYIALGQMLVVGGWGLYDLVHSRPRRRISPSGNGHLRADRASVDEADR